MKCLCLPLLDNWTIIEIYRGKLDTLQHHLSVPAYGLDKVPSFVGYASFSVSFEYCVASSIIWRSETTASLLSVTGSKRVYHVKRLIWKITN